MSSVNILRKKTPKAVKSWDDAANYRTFLYHWYLYRKYSKSLCHMIFMKDVLFCLDDGQIHVPESFPSRLLKALTKENCRFIFLLLIMSKKEEKRGHANALIIDKKEKTIERYNPRVRIESGTYTTNIIGDKLNEAIEKTFCDGVYIIRYINLNKLCLPFQFEKDDKGYCEAWTAWYIDFRLANQHIPIEDALQQAHNKIKQSGQTFTHFIENYFNYILDKEEKLGFQKVETFNERIKHLIALLNKS